MIEYSVSAQQAKAHIFDVKVVISKPTARKQRISLANWTPGSYLIRDFARHVISIKAFKASNPNDHIEITKLNGNTWEVESSQGPLIIEYQVYAYDLSVRGAYLDDEQAFINGAALFLRIHDHEHANHRVLFSTPWKCATTLTRVATKAKKYQQYQATSYDELIDHPIQFGIFEQHDFEVLGIPHSLVISGEHDGDVKQLIRDVQKVCENQLTLFGMPAPFENYLFLLTVRKDAYGGLEHRSSTALHISPECMPLKGMLEKSPSYVTLLALFSHEYFHSWNIKKIKPSCFQPYNLDEAAYTSQLWAFEGITSYYDDLALIRAKVISLEQYLDILAQNITRLLRNPGRKKQTLLESSFDAWTKFYQPNENSPNALVSYYLKGSLVALALDLFLRKSTKHRVSLDTIVKYLWEHYGKSQKGVPEKAIEKTIVKLGGKAIEPLVHQALYTTDDLSFSELLAPFGLELNLREALGTDDLGGKRDCAKGSSSRSHGSMHCAYTRLNGKIVISVVYEGGVAQEAGLCPHDEIVAINNWRVDADTFEKILKRFTIGQKIKLIFFRHDQLKTRNIILGAPNKDTAQIILQPNLTREMNNNLNKWLLYEPHSVS